MKSLLKSCRPHIQGRLRGFGILRSFKRLQWCRHRVTCVLHETRKKKAIPKSHDMECRRHEEAKRENENENNNGKKTVSHFYASGIFAPSASTRLGEIHCTTRTFCSLLSMIIHTVWHFFTLLCATGFVHCSERTPVNVLPVLARHRLRTLSLVVSCIA